MLFSCIEALRGWLMPFPFWLKGLGPRGEYLARRYYHRRGYHCLARNWRHGRWELDLVMANYRRLLFVEVKTRRYRPGRRIGDVLRHRQKRRLLKLAKIYLDRWKAGEIPWAFCLVLVTFRGRGGPSIQTAILR